jgi:hypothetical protein
MMPNFKKITNKVAIFSGVRDKKVVNMIAPRKRRTGALPICIFCYHKVGTALLSKIFGQICKAADLSFQVLYGKQTQLPQDFDVTLFAHSLVDFNKKSSPFIGVHIIRDPRDIIVSGYLHHCRTVEKWCTNTDFSQNTPILFPRVPLSQQHRTEKWKIRYLESLEGISYQQKLLNMSVQDGLLFEMSHYGAWTIQSMREWDYHQDNILELQFESLMNNYDNTFRLIFSFLGFSETEIEVAISIAEKHDIGRKSSKEIQKMTHVYSKKTTKWAEYFDQIHREAFYNKFGDVLIELDYEKSVRS